MASNIVETEETNTEENDPETIILDDSLSADKKIGEGKIYEDIKSKVEILDAVFHPNEPNLIVVALINGKIKIYDVAKTEKRLVSAHKLHKSSVRKVAFPIGNADLIFTASKDLSIKLTDLKHESNVLSLDKCHDAPITCLKTIDNWLIASADENGCVKIWDYRKKTAVMESKADCQDYISDLAVSKDKKILLATCGEGTLSAFHTKKKKMILQSELMDSEMLCVTFMKDGKKAICGTGDGVISVFNNGEFGNMSDRFPGHPSSIDCMLPINDDIVLTGCFDGNIRACYILPNRFLGIVGGHDGFPVESLSLSCDGKVCASISHDERVKFWNVENIQKIKVGASSKSESKKLRNKTINSKGKADNFFSDLIETKETEATEDDEDDDENDDDEDEDDDSSDDDE